MTLGPAAAGVALTGSRRCRTGCLHVLVVVAFHCLGIVGRRND